MSELSKPHIDFEDFRFTINTTTSMVSVSDLLSYLANYEAMAKSVNQVLNKNGCIGYDQVLVEIEAFVQGSFDIKGRLKKITENPTFAAVSAAVVTVLITKALSTDTTPTVVINNYEGAEVTINYEQLIESKDLVMARSNIAKTAIADPYVNSISVTYGYSETKSETKRIELNTLESIIVEEIEDKNVVCNFYSKARLKIIAPVLESEPASWRVSFDGRKISAFMYDEDFLKKMRETKIAFGMGDVIIADLEIKVKKVDGKKFRPKYYIRKVYKYPEYSSQLRNEQSLFGNIDMD